VFTDVIYEEPEPGGSDPRLAADSYEVPPVLVRPIRVKGRGSRLADPDRDDGRAPPSATRPTESVATPGDLEPETNRER
jgi:hypothetical protein